MTWNLEPIGTVVGGRAEPEDDHWRDVEAVIQLTKPLTPDATKGLEDFSHIDVVYGFHLLPADKVSWSARAPREREDLPEVGILAQRARARPNRLGVSTCELVKVEGLRLHVRSLDAVAGSPVFDVKPYVAAMGPQGRVREPRWMRIVMKEYW